MPSGSILTSDRPEARHFLHALHIIGELPDHRLQLARHLIGQLRQRTAAGNVDEIPLVRLARRQSAAYTAGRSDRTAYSQCFGMPSARAKSFVVPSGRMPSGGPVRLAGHPVDHLIQRPVAARGDDQCRSRARRFRGRQRRVAFAVVAWSARLDAALLQPLQNVRQPASDLFAAGRRIINQSRPFDCQATPASSMASAGRPLPPL